MSEHHYSRRKWANRIVLILSGVAAGLAIMVLAGVALVLRNRQGDVGLWAGR